MESDGREEGEMSDDSMSVDEDPPSNLSSKPISGSGGKTDFLLDLAGGTAIKLEKVDIALLEDRAKQFGILLAIGQRDIDDLYENLGVDDATERHIQFDTIHLKGIETLKKNDIFIYLKDYEPVTVEKITESSCNITFKDHIAACLAILVHSQDIVEENIKSKVNSSGNHYWREGHTHPNCKLILMRFATKSDVIASTKESNKKWISNKRYRLDGHAKNPWGELCMSWGINDHQEVYGPKLPPTSYMKTDIGIVRLNPQIPYDDSLRPRLISRNLARRIGKRQHYINISTDEDSNSDEEWVIKSKVPRMRMRADDEEEKTKPPNVGEEKQDIKDKYPSLSIQIDNVFEDDTDYNPGKTPLSQTFSKNVQSKSRCSKSTLAPQKVKPSIHSRLGLRVEDTECKPNSDGELSEDSVSSYKETHVMSRVHKVPTKITLQSVWTRLEKPETKKRSREANAIQLCGQSDLRKKLKENRRSPLRVEIDNEYYESD